MCTETRASRPRLLCALLILLGIILPPGSCQNAEPRGSFGTRSIAKRMDFLRDEFGPDDMDQHWDASPEGKQPPDEDGSLFLARGPPEMPKTDVEEATDTQENRNKALLPPEAPADPPLQPGMNVTASASSNRRRGDRGRKKRRRGKDGQSIDAEDQERNSSIDMRENEIRGKRGQTSERRNGSSSKKTSKDQQARKYRAERRRRRKNRERKRGRKRSRANEERIKDRLTAKLKSRMNDAPAALLFEGSGGQESNTDSSKYIPENSSNGTSWMELPNESSYSASSATISSNLQEQLTTDRERKSSQTTPRYGSYADTVEREFSKQLEREIFRARMEDPSSLENRILGTSLSRATIESTSRKQHKEGTSARRYEGKASLGHSRYDVAKMLGYSRTEEDLPILDLENQVLARTLQDYNAYMKSSARLSTHPRKEEAERHRMSASRPHGKPIIDSADFKSLQEPWRPGTAAATTATYDQDNAKGDLSCINGTFVPAPLARHALIKYVKSSTPGQEYLEADYECAPGYYLASTSTRLLCRNRQWVGQMPRCKVKQGSDGPCSETSCDQVCKEIDGKAVCSCYKGFQLEGNRCIDVDECAYNHGGCEHKCVNSPGSYHCECPKGMRRAGNGFTCTDINECLLNNGHGPCQDTCRNLVGGYECSCVGLRDAILSADNHTCQDLGPCSVNNAGCSHTCLSTMGRVFCLCPDGFILEEDWKTCQDIDECTQPDLQTELCRIGCINTPGSYRCTDTLELKDQPEEETLSITCLPGYEATSAGTCIDINECMIDNGGCIEVCENTDGSFFCACDGDEKALSSDGKSCVDINDISCPPLNPAGRGYLMCSRLATPKPWRGRRKVGNRPGTKCFLKCPHGYQLHGEYELSCRSDGTWDGPKHGECVRYGKPRLECPKDVVAELPPGRDEAFVTFDQPSTDLDWFRYVRSKPSWGTRLEANLKPGGHEIAFFARHPVSKKQASCTLRIIVKGGEAPKVNDCPNDIEVTGRNGTAITWSEPIFTDNVKVTRITSNESPGRRFNVGGHRIEYEAADEAGWSSKCVFTVVLRAE